jgi:hypothetical protein
MKNLKFIFFIPLILLVFSCDKEEGTSVVGDVFAISKKSGSTTVYALAYYAYSYSALKSVTVTNSLDSSTKISLSDSGYTGIFYKEPSDSDFSTTKPSSAIYTFDTVMESGNSYTSYDQLTATILEPPTIEKCQYNSSYSYIEITWDALTNADRYAVIALDSSGTQVFQSSLLVSSTVSGYISQSTSTWSSGHPATGKIYTIRVIAYKYEDSNNPSTYNVQSTSYSEATVTWGS